MIIFHYSELFDTFLSSCKNFHKEKRLELLTALSSLIFLIAKILKQNLINNTTPTFVLPTVLLHNNISFTLLN